jgi:hypothetical protein
MKLQELSSDEGQLVARSRRKPEVGLPCMTRSSVRAGFSLANHLRAVDRRRRLVLVVARSGWRSSTEEAATRPGPENPPDRGWRPRFDPELNFRDASVYGQ